MLWAQFWARISTDSLAVFVFLMPAKVLLLKNFTSQLIVLAQLALRLAKVRGKVSQERIDFLEAKLQETPKIIDLIIKTQEGNVSSKIEIMVRP